MSTNKSVAINVEHVTRVEGHGNITVNVRNGVLEKCQLDIVEAPRCFEAMVRGKPYYQIQPITCRICGICSVAHSFASLRATEDAMGVELSEQTLLLRKLMLDGEYLQSHILHVLFLVAPDLLKVGSVFPLAASAPEVVLMALRMKKLGNDISAILGGRHVHPVAVQVGGFSYFPTVDELKSIQQRLIAYEKDLDTVVDLLAQLSFLDFEQETEYIALKKPDEFALYDGPLASSKQSDTVPQRNYRELVNEYIQPHSTAKHARARSESYMVGALARLQINNDLLSPKAKMVAQKLGFTAPTHNPFHNNVAQLIETAHCWEEALQITEELLRRGVQPEKPQVQVKAGRGVGIVEAPRGTLIHEYTYDDKGILLEANCIIPTGQNYANIERNMRGMVPQILDKSEDEIRLLCEMLVRAYDPCISCSTHLLEVEFVR